MRVTTLLATVAAIGGAGAAAYVGVVTGRLSLDLDIGRRTRPLGPITVDIAAPRETAWRVWRRRWLVVDDRVGRRE